MHFYVIFKSFTHLVSSVLYDVLCIINNFESSILNDSLYSSKYISHMMLLCKGMKKFQSIEMSKSYDSLTYRKSIGLFP